jgi:DNA-binding MarR family transcriptional regulator
VVLSRSNLTRLVDRLEEAGLVARERSEEDRRGAYAVITAEGREVRRKMWPTYEAGIRAVFDSQLGEAEARSMAAALQRMLDAARGVLSRATPVKRAR